MKFIIELHNLIYIPPLQLMNKAVNTIVLLKFNNWLIVIYTCNIQFIMKKQISNFKVGDCYVSVP